MAIPESTLAHRLQSFPRWGLYLLLFVATSLPLFIKLPIPNEPQPAAVGFYKAVMDLPEGGTVLVASDWTNSTRGESMGSFRGLIRILMRKNIKFALYSTGDPQAPKVAENVINSVIAEQKAAGEKEYVRYEDWVMIGFLPNSEGIHTGMSADYRAVFANMRDTGKPVNNSPVLADIKRVQDFKMLFCVTGSKTTDIILERLYGKVPLAFMVTGVMAPETLNYFASGQILGLIGGLKGVYDLEQMMEFGVNWAGPDGQTKIKVAGAAEIPGFPGKNNVSTGTKYYPALHAGIGLLILAVVVGNVGMFLARKQGGR